MQTPLELVSRDFKLPRGLRAVIERRVAKLDALAPRLTSCHVAVERPHGRGRTGLLYQVRLDLRLPGRDVSVTRRSGETPLEAVQAAFDAAERRLRGSKGRRATAWHPREEPLHGRVTEVYPIAGYGFLEGADGKRVYFDERSVLHDGFGRLEPGVVVRYAEEEGVEGPQASTVEV